jgi:hypothetical protein
MNRAGEASSQAVQRGKYMKSLVAALVIVVVLALSAVALADPSSPENGCHGYYTTQYKEQVGDRGGQGSAIGGKGNSDGDPANGQAHSEAGRGQTLQEFLAANCGVGSQTP